jgi:hypothetical protein
MKTSIAKLRTFALIAIAALVAWYPVAVVAKAAANVYEFMIDLATPKQSGGFVAGANTLTSLIPSLYESLDIISREMVGFIPSVTLDAGASRAAVGQTVTIPLAPASAASDITPAVTAPNDGDQTVGNTTITITKARAVPFRWNGEEQLGLNNNGAGYAGIRNQQIIQAMRTLTNEIEADLAGLFTRSSRAYGTPGTTPFASNLGDPAQVRKILMDNGAPGADLQLVVDTTSGAALRTLAQLTKVNESGDTQLLRQGILLPLHGFDVRESAGVKTPAKGTGASYVTSGTYAIGATAITLATGTGTVLAGDVVTFLGDTNKYVVATGVAAPGVVTLAAPGLRQSLGAGVALTVANVGARNMAFHRSALVLASRAPALPVEGDSADDRITVTDPRSGMTFEVAMYKQYRQVRYEMAIAWGVAGIKPEHTAVLLG